jgi:hypothetical protein
MFFRNIGNDVSDFTSRKTVSSSPSEPQIPCYHAFISLRHYTTYEPFAFSFLRCACFPSSARAQNQQAGPLQDATIIHCLLTLHAVRMQTLLSFRSGLLVLLVLRSLLSHMRNNLPKLSNIIYALNVSIYQGHHQVVFMNYICSYGIIKMYPFLHLSVIVQSKFKF